MVYEKAKQIKKELSNFLPCHKYAFVAPVDQGKFKSFLKMAWDYNNSHKPLIRLMTDDSRIDEILTDNFSNADFEVYVVSTYFKGSTKPQTFSEYIQMEEIDFDPSKFN